QQRAFERYVAKLAVEAIDAVGLERAQRDADAFGPDSQFAGAFNGLACYRERTQTAFHACNPAALRGSGIAYRLDPKEIGEPDKGQHEAIDRRLVNVSWGTGLLDRKIGRAHV